jgi:hypothetical protein
MVRACVEGIMATTGFVNLTDSLLNQTVQEFRAAASTTAAASVGALANPRAPLDLFVPSSRTGIADATAEAAGLFTATQFSLITAAQNSLLARSVATALLQPGTPATASASAPRATGADIPAPGTFSIQTQLQTLNNALAQLGLNAADIQKVDRIASVINDFNATTFTNLIHQLKALAANAAQKTAQASTVSHNTNVTGAPGTNSNGGNFALQLQLNFVNSNGQTGPAAQAVGVTVNLLPAQTRAATG